MEAVGVDESVRESLRRGDLGAAATRAVEAYGPEVLGFLVTLLRDEDDAKDVFSQACENLWRGLARFEGRSSLRTWFYTLARHAAISYRRSPHRHSQRRVALSQIGDVAERVRSQTMSFLRPALQDGVAAIREELDKDDHTLLILRVDRELDWNDIARIFLADCDASDVPNERIKREAARLRKRFQLIKTKIRERARAAGLVSERDS